MSDGPDNARPNIDHARRAVSIPRRLMPTLLAIHAGNDVQPIPAVDELESGGLIAAHGLDPLLVTLIDVMTDPTLVVTVEVAGARNPRLATFWGTPRRAVVGTTDDRRRFDLLQIDPDLLPFHLAQTTGLSPRPHPPFTGGCEIPVQALSLAEDLIAEQLEDAEEALAAAGVPSLWADRLLIALAHRRRLWTVESIWLGPSSGKYHSRLTVLDAGSAGYWRLADQPGQDVAHLAVSDFDELLRAFAELLPGPPHGESGKI